MIDRTFSRRTFLKQATAVTALGMLYQIPGTRLLAATPVELLPDPDEALLRELALRAVDAARSAGASFADVRLAMGRYVMLRGQFDANQFVDPAMSVPDLTVTISYGIRAVVDGTWGMASGQDLSPDAITAAAQAAVARARANRPRRARTLELAPAPVVEDGRWATPIAEDPFDIPIGQQGDLMLDAISSIAGFSGLRSAMIRLTWQRSNRVFASSEGTVQVQQIDLAFPRASVNARAGREFRYTSEGVDALRSGGYGFETVSSLNLAEELRHAWERAVEKSKDVATPVSTEVGRYDLVLSAQAAASVLSQTLGRALNAERALGYRMNRDGTSFAAPPIELLGTMQVGSPLLTVRADRSEPHAPATVGWDDEGVKPSDMTLVQDGVLMDYLTTRQTAAEVAPWYRNRGEQERSNGCASGAGLRRPSVQLPNLTIVPGADEVSVEDLIADTRRGFYLDNAGGIADQQVLTGQFRGAGIREIRDGKLGKPIKDFAFHFITPDLWRSLDALGGPTSSEQVLTGTEYMTARDGIQLPFASVRAVPVRFREVNVLNTGRTA